MDPMLIAQVIFGALVGGACTGVVSWIKFSNALAIMRVDVNNIMDRCAECRKLFKDEIVSQRTAEHERHVENKRERVEENAVRIVQTKMDADALERRLSEINDRLASIEEHLRISKSHRTRGAD